MTDRQNQHRKGELWKSAVEKSKIINSDPSKWIKSCEVYAIIKNREFNELEVKKPFEVEYSIYYINIIM
jgi:hypothetical protein